MKSFKALLAKQGYTLMSDGVQIFDGAVVTAMDKIRLWDQMAQSYMKEVDGVQYFISMGYNGDHFKTDGQQYCTHLHIAKPGKCYLHACLCEFRQKDIERHIIDLVGRADAVIALAIDGTYSFEDAFQEKKQSYPWQTSN